jgi:sec-independent protein translocase protein TatC
MLKVPLDMAKGALNKGLQRKALREAQAQNHTAEMSLVDHIIELRGHLVRSALYVAVFAVVAFFFMDPLLAFLRSPFEEYQRAAGKDARLMTTAVFEVIFMNFKVCLLTAAVAAVPFVLWEVWRFVSPALYPHERFMARPLVFGSVLMFYAGVSFGFFVIVPAFLSNTLEWASQYAEVMLTVENYFNSLATMVFIFGIIFEVPIILSLLGLAGVIKASTIVDNRRVVFFASCVIGALLSPPDIFSLMITTVPLYGMVEVSVVALRYIERSRARRQAAAVSAEVDGGAQ